jgi:hypothetical protein
MGGIKGMEKYRVIPVSMLATSSISSSPFDFTIVMMMTIGNMA